MLTLDAAIPGQIDGGTGLSGLTHNTYAITISEYGSYCCGHGTFVDACCSTTKQELFVVNGSTRQKNPISFQNSLTSTISLITVLTHSTLSFPQFSASSFEYSIDFNVTCIIFGKECCLQNRSDSGRSDRRHWPATCGRFGLETSPSSNAARLQYGKEMLQSPAPSSLSALSGPRHGENVHGSSEPRQWRPGNGRDGPDIAARFVEVMA